MSNIVINGADALDQLLDALAEHLVTAQASFDVVVIGGSALLALGLTERATRDIDLVGLVTGPEIKSADPLPEALLAARDRVARDFRLPASWFNSGPTGLLRFGLPAGFAERLEVRHYGNALTVRFASRIDQIHFKLYATVDDGGPGKHSRDLLALAPTSEELIQAARWTRTHDPSDGYRVALCQALDHFGIHEPDLDE